MPFCKSYNRLLDEHLHILIAQGNHEAYIKLKNRYHRYAESFSQEILSQYQGSGIARSDLVCICDACFIYVVKKYDPQRCSFYSFWKEIVEKSIIDYYVDNSYLANAKVFRGFLSFDDEFDERRIADERVCEADDKAIDEKRLKELRKIIIKNKKEFKPREFMLLNMLIDGYDLSDLDHSNMISTSVLYLTFNSACEKLKLIIEEEQKKYQ